MKLGASSFRKSNRVAAGAPTAFLIHRSMNADPERVGDIHLCSASFGTPLQRSGTAFDSAHGQNGQPRRRSLQHWITWPGRFLGAPLIRAALFSVVLPMLGAPTVQADVLTVVNFGDPASEARHNVTAQHAESVGYTYPSHWVINVRASGFQPGQEPYRAIDGNDGTHWEVSGKPPPPMERGQWIELDFNRAIKLETVSIRWLGDRLYRFKIYDKPFEDFRRVALEATSSGQSAELETVTLPEPVVTRAVRIEFVSETDGVPQGI